MELVPQPLAHLLRRVQREPDATKGRALFDLPAAKQWRGTSDGLDLSRRFHGERAANVVGPAAGPHTQLAQNIALSYLAGARILELKTVQIMDELEIPRPCIDAANIGFNVEWSQELKIEQSTEEYAKAALLIAALRRMGHPEGLDERDEGYLLDLSLGYDLAGIQSERITGFVRTMLDASAVLDRLLDELPKDLSHLRDLDVPPRLISCVTLSTFHGCPANEIESIARYLLEELGVHVVVKLNPTLLGFEEVGAILHDALGYRELELKKQSFDEDLQWDQALAMIGRLRSVAHDKDLMFGVKLTNTLVVKNHKDFFPGEKEMYLSGQPLHVISTQLLAKLRSAIPAVGPGGAPPVVYSFSAGIDQHNFPLAAAADLCPVTTCTDLLRPGGYARLPKYLENLEREMRAVKAADLDELILKRHGEAKAAAEAIGPEVVEAAEALEGGRLEDVLARFGDRAEEIRRRWVHECGTRNAVRLAKAALEDPRYKKEKNSKTPKKIGSALELFDCINCDKCVPVCPNDANFVYEVEPVRVEAPTWVFGKEGVTEAGTVTVDVQKSHQLATYVDFCNACGNCDVFCPEDGGPYHMKPHWFGSRAAFEAEGRIEGFFLESPDVLVGRVGGRVVRLDLGAGEEVSFEDGVVRLEAALEEGPRLLWHQLLVNVEGHRVESGQLLVLAALARGVMRTVNPVSAPFL